MTPSPSIATLPTHNVTNQPPDLENYNLYQSDEVLRNIIQNFQANEYETNINNFGQLLGQKQTIELGYLANNNPPILNTFDRYGYRIDEITFDPSYHQLMELAFQFDVHSIVWKNQGAGRYVGHAALLYLLTQIESGVCCPIVMTHAASATLQKEDSIYQQWKPKLLSNQYDPRYCPIEQKFSATIGMAMTEKQGGSDLRKNTTKANLINKNSNEYLLTGHKWFCSAPMSDAFLTLAQTDKGLSCFFVPRWQPDGSRNPFYIQRLKAKLGNHANASSEIEYNQTWAKLIGEEGRGINTIISMVDYTRLDTAIAPAGLMRQALVQAIHHAYYRNTFDKLLVEHTLMKNVLADLAIESEAATLLAFYAAHCYDQDHGKPLTRLITALAKFWLNKRAPLHIVECLECLGGNGYCETFMMPRLYREAPLNGIWEGSANIICMDLLRIYNQTPEVLEQFISLLSELQHSSVEYRRVLEQLKRECTLSPLSEGQIRLFASQAALLLQAYLLYKFSLPWIADLFVRTRLSESWKVFGTLPKDIPYSDIIERAFLKK
jgi:putative acyl-CoA dehydrogenase